MRKKTREFSLDWSRPKSLYKEDDYRSENFKNNWVTVLLSLICKEAIKQNKNFLDVAYKFTNNKHEHYPRKIYKFYSCSINSFNCLENNTVYMSSPKDFNDPFDCYIGINEQEFIKKYVLHKIAEEKLIEKGVITNQQYYELVNSVCYDINDRFYFKDKPKEFRNLFYKNYYDTPLFKLYYIALGRFTMGIKKVRNQRMKICSFANLTEWELRNSIEMWAHYAENHTGFCVEYDLSKYKLVDSLDINLPDKENIILSGLFPCFYKSAPPKIPKLLLYKQILEEKLTKKEQINLEKFLVNAFITKSTSWSYEHEWRLILDEQFCDVSNNLIKFANVCSVYLGGRISANNKENILKIGQRNGFEIYQGEFENNEFAYHFHNIDPVKYFEEKQYQEESKQLKYQSKL